MNSVSLSNIELYNVTSQYIGSSEIEIHNDEYYHIVKVMRHKINDDIYVTDGEGKIYKTRIKDIQQNSIECVIDQVMSYENNYANIFFCIPKLKAFDRFEFALEKSVELGITNFIIFNAAKCISKTEKPDRWQKILISAMKQSLRSYLPKIQIVNSLKEIITMKGEKIILEQNSNNSIMDFNLVSNKNYYFIFGPEGGLDKKELALMNGPNIISLGLNRLRTETAIISLASLLTSKK